MKPDTLRKAHFWLANLWMGLTIPTILWWKTSILWVAIVSIYANWISEITAWGTARTEVRAEELQGRDAKDKDDDRLTWRHLELILARTEAQNIAILSWMRWLASQEEA